MLISRCGSRPRPLDEPERRAGGSQSSRRPGGCLDGSHLAADTPSGKVRRWRRVCTWRRPKEDGENLDSSLRPGVRGTGLGPVWGRRRPARTSVFEKVDAALPRELEQPHPRRRPEPFVAESQAGVALVDFRANLSRFPPIRHAPVTSWRRKPLTRRQVAHRPPFIAPSASNFPKVKLVPSGSTL